MSTFNLNFIYNKELASAKQIRRRLERKFAKTKLVIDQQLLKAQRYRIRKMSLQQKAKVVRNKLEIGNTKQLFETVKSLSVPITQTLPNGYSSNNDLADVLGSFFDSKVMNIVSGFLSDSVINEEYYAHRSVDIVFDDFELLSMEVGVGILRKLKCSSHMDLLPQSKFALFWPVMLPVIHKLVNISFSSGIFPTAYKQSHIIPILKSPDLDPDELKSYRPVSNLPFISKVLETAVHNQLVTHFVIIYLALINRRIGKAIVWSLCFSTFMARSHKPTMGTFLWGDHGADLLEPT